MENTQSPPNQNLTETVVQQQTSSNNSRVLVIVIISVLLTGVITGSATYFWQKSANERTISSLKEEIISLEEQLSKLENTEVALQPTSLPELSSELTAAWKTYVSNDFGISFKYPEDGHITTRKRYSEGGRCDGLERFIDLGLNSANIKFDLCAIPYGLTGSEAENLEITQQLIVVDGKQVALGNQKLIEKNIYNKESLQQYRLVTTDYPPGSKNILGENVYVISIRYEDTNDSQTNIELYHRTLSTFKFTD